MNNIYLNLDKCPLLNDEESKVDEIHMTGICLEADIITLGTVLNSYHPIVKI